MALSLQTAADDLLSSYIIFQAQALETAAAICPAHQVQILHALHGRTSLDESWTSGHVSFGDGVRMTRCCWASCMWCIVSMPAIEFDSLKVLIIFPDSAAACRSCGLRKSLCALNSHQNTQYFSQALLRSVQRCLP